MEFGFELELPDLIEEGELVKRLSKMMDDELDVSIRLFNRLTDPWDAEHHPVWEKRKSKLEGGDLKASIHTSSVPFAWVNNGHKGGRVTFSDDYRPRTKYHSLRSGPKTGRVLKRGRGARPKRPVKGRRFDQKAAEVRRKMFVRKGKRQTGLAIKKMLSSKQIEVEVIL